MSDNRPISLPMLRGLWAYRGFVLGSVGREFRARYGNAMLGGLWSLLSPLAMIVVYTVVFAQVMQSRLPGNDKGYAYSIYLCAGILTWGLFADIVARAQTMFIDQANLLKKVHFPRLCLPVAAVLGALLNFGIIFGLFTVFLIISGNFPGWAFAAVLPLLAVEILFAIGLGLIVGVLNVFFRDIGQMCSIVMQFWFWFTPIVYPASILPEGLRALLVMNPMASIISGWQRVLVEGQLPDWATLAPPLLLAVMLCLLGMRLFRQRAGDMVDEI